MGFRCPNNFMVKVRRETISRWRISLESLLPRIQHGDYQTMVLSCNLERIYMVTQVEDFTGSHYMYNRDRAIDRIERYLKAINMKKAPTLSTQG